MADGVALGAADAALAGWLAAGVAVGEAELRGAAPVVEVDEAAVLDFDAVEGDGDGDAAGAAAGPPSCADDAAVADVDAVVE